MKDDIKNKILKLNHQVPRYTSYPTAPHFYGLRNERTYPDWLASIPADENISLYIHIPFCKQMCWYCGCNTKATRKYDPIKDYIDYLLKEVDLVQVQLSSSVKVSHLHFGGGSPTMLKALDFARIMEHLYRKFSFSEDAEIAIEVDPRNVTEARVATYAKYGVKRVSLGIQDFDTTVLKAVNRPQPYHVSYDAITLFRKYGIKQINVDMLYGLPHQTIDSMKESFAKLLTLNPTRISFFGYAHVPWVKKHMRLINEDALPNAEERLELNLTGQDFLIKHGYKAIGIDHFAKPDDTIYQAFKAGNLHRNFQGYTTDDATTMIGLGVSSIGQFKQGFVQNARSLNEYKEALDHNKFPAQKCCVTSCEDKIRAEVIETLMCTFSVDLKEICKQHGFSSNHFDLEILLLQPYINDGLITVSNNSNITIVPKAYMLVRMVCAVFDLYFNSSSVTPKHSQAV